jgi:hypothetical protein
MENESNKQTAVEWLELQIKDLIPNDIGSQLKFKNKIKQAKQINKKQIEDAYWECLTSNFNSFEQYYNETYGGKDGE